MAASRFTLETPAGPVPSRLPGAEAVLSLAITLACKADEQGVWTVREYEDVLYRVTRKDGPLAVIVEALR